MNTKLVCLAFLFCLVSAVLAGGKSDHGNIVLSGCGGKTILTGGGKKKGGGSIIMHENCHHDDHWGHDSWGHSDSFLY